MAEDKTFILNFSAIILGLVIFTFAIIVLAIRLAGSYDSADNPSQLTTLEERITPVAAVNTGDYVAPASSAAPVASAPASTPAVSNADGELPADAVAAVDTGASAINGEEVYNGICAACHNAGVAGAPVPGGTMNERASKGLDALVASAINGIGIMPARGGNPSLTDEQIRASVEYMLEQ